MNPNTETLRAMLRAHLDQAALFQHIGKRSAARAAQRRAETVKHALRARREFSHG